ncbi:MAG: S8 family peptidase [Actinobacteria bacterium]|nr:S8 family peptidase [Actinomycetota bacterium]
MSPTRLSRVATVAAATIAVMAITLPATADHGEGLVPPTGQAVVALIDTGINPYHVEFRDDSELAQQHPSTYIDGYPEDVPALHLTLDAPDYETAMQRDCETWRSVERGQLYWIPGTKIVGAASFRNANPSCGADGLEGQTHILDSSGHGTMVASRAAANTFGACPSCRIVAVEFPTSIPIVLPTGSENPAIEAISWTADQRGWIDVQSNSWGPFVPVYDPTGAGGLLGANPRFVSEVERVSAAQPAFWASGNGAAFRGGVLGHPTFLTPHATPSAIMVGGHDSGHVQTWPGFPPHLVSDSCDSWAAQARTMDETGARVGGGTSGATPFVAGGGARILAEARLLLGDTTTGQTDGQADGAVVAQGEPGAIEDGPLADGVLTRDEWQRILYTTATPRPEAQFEDGPPCGVRAAPYNETPVHWSDVPEGFPEYLNIGYGAVDDPAVALAFQVLRGEEALPDRTQTDRYFQAHHILGGITHQIYTAPSGAFATAG